MIDEIQVVNVAGVAIIAARYQIYPLSKMALTFEPLKGFQCPSGFRKVFIIMT